MKQPMLTAFGTLFENLPEVKEDPKNEDYITKLQLAAFSSLRPLSKNVKSKLGLSHTIGHAIGSPYGISPGTSSCIPLPGVVRLKGE